jgi:ABC-2 type transport system permease protein
MRIAELIGLEWRRLRRDLVFWTSVALACLALWYGLANGAAWMRFEEQAIAKAGAIGAEKRAFAKAEAQRRNEDPDKEIGTFDDPRSAIGFESRYLRLYDCRPPLPLAMAVIGQSDLLPYCVRVTAGPLAAYAANYEWENPLRLLLGRFDCAFAVLALLPLLALAFSYNLLSREKELGTLPLLLSTPVSLTRWLGACFFLRGLIFLGAVLGAALLGFWAAGFDFGAEGALISLALWLVLIVAYLAFWLALAFAVNARGKSSATNALTLAGLWLLFVVLIPSSLNLAVKTLYPLPPRIAFINALRQASDESSRKTSDLLQSFLHDHPDLAAGSTRRAEFGSRRLAVNAATEAATEPLRRSFAEQNEHQQAMIDHLRFLSPAILFQQAGAELAGNDPARHRRFLAAVETHRTMIKQFFGPAFVSDALFAEFDEVPPFVYVEEPPALVVPRVATGVIFLVLASLALAALGVIAMRPMERGPRHSLKTQQ